MEITISKDAHEGYDIRGPVFCCMIMTHAHCVHGQVHFGLVLGEPVFIIGEVIGQYCPFCGDKLTCKEKENEIQG